MIGIEDEAEYCRRLIAGREDRNADGTVNLDLFDMPDEIRAECDEIASMLCRKNAAYGNSVFDPVRIFSKADPIEQINVRIDDKLSRLARGSLDEEDVELDLIGYLVLKRIALRLGIGKI